MLPKSGVGQAIEYTLKRWDALCRFLEDGRLELDNNRSERNIRRLAVGRKNWMNFGNERGGRAAAVFYTLIASSKAHELDSRVYLHDVMLRISEGARARLQGLPARRSAADRRGRRSQVAHAA